MTDTRPVPVTVSGARSVGVDVARAIALLGMMAAHVGDVAEFPSITDPATWSAVVNGRSSTLFAVLAGVSIALVTGRTTPPGRPSIGRMRARLAVRAAVVVVVGLVLMAIGSPAYVILPVYGVLFVLAIPVLRWSRRALVVAAGVCAVASVPAAVVTAIAFGDVDPYTPGGMFAVQLGVVYPFVTFFAYVLVGLAIGRSDLTARRAQWTLLGTGTTVAAVAYTVGIALAPIPGNVWRDAFPGIPWAGRDPSGASAQLWLSPRDHSSSLVDVVATAGIAAAVIGLCLLLVDGRGPRTLAVVAPLAAVGSMPLSVYALHLVVLVVADPPSGVWTWCWFAVGSVVFAVVWRRFAGRGPLERLTARLTGMVPLPDATLRR